MATTKGVGVTPNAPDVGIVKGLFYERFGQDGQAEIANRIAPLSQMSEDEGSYAYEGASFLGVNLSEDGTLLTETALESTQYRNLELTYESKPYRLKRWRVPTFQIGDRMQAKLRRVSGIDVEESVERRIRTRLQSIHTHQVISAATTSSNYLASHTYDPGDLSSASFDLLTAITTLVTRLTDSGVSDSAPLLVVGSPTEVNRLLRLTQVQAYGAGAFAAPNSNLFMEQGRLETILSEMAGRPVQVAKAAARYVQANGTAAYSATAGVLSWVIAAGGMEQSLLKTLYVDSGPTEMVSVRTQRDEAIPGYHIFADGYWDVHVGDTTAGICWTGIAS